MDLKLNGKVAVVTAASRGLGRAVAEAMAKEGVKLAICARKKDLLDETAKYFLLYVMFQILLQLINLRKSLLSNLKLFIFCLQMPVVHHQVR